MSKISCTKCQTPFEQTEARKKARHHRCNVCTAASVMAWRKRNPEKCKGIIRKVPQKYNPESGRRRYETVKADPVESMKLKARNTLGNAIHGGKIQRQPCEICGAVKSEAHHHDYSKPLEVRWVCGPHHRAIHKGEIQ